MITVEQLQRDITALGVVPGDTVMLHVSLRAIGPIEHGPAGLLEALTASLGDDGTLLMILGAEITHDWVNKRPEAERAALLADAPVFDPLQAPVFCEVGYFAEVLRTATGTRVTDNPSGRFGARGRLAEALLHDAPWHDYYGPGSPLARLCEADGKILRIGANPDTTTVLHYAEYLADVPNKRRVRRHYRCQGPEGPSVRAVECLDDEEGIVHIDGEDYFARILNEYLALDRARRGHVGNAPATLIRAADIAAFGARWMTEEFRTLTPSTAANLHRR
ncbi:MAG: AAC(3) family N-acetyltransferase [Methyloceanibacter sp.]|nr:AAC(3) family N-acetyltransferase [Methyloceanibacter sp.]